MRYRAVHTTDYRYEGPVLQCQSELRLTPRTLPWQRVVERAIAIVPEPASIDARVDYFGNAVTSCAILERHERFTIVASSLIDVDARAPRPAADVPWEAARNRVAAHETPETLEALEFVFDSPFVPTAPELAAFARPSFPAGRGLMAGVDDLCQRIHREFTYKPASTAIDTPVLETLRSKRGVCQDFSHVMIGALRSIGLPARYVSGYLRSGADYQGAEASHAWVSVCAPGQGWFDSDPTNDLVPGEGHVTLAWGRDYGDVTPVKGVALGGGAHTVTVEVRVDPM